MEGAARSSEPLARLESWAIRALRDAVSACRRPAMLFSAGKDSCVLLRLARKAFAPAPPPFPLLSVDTTWDFPEICSFRDRAARSAGMELIVQVNREGARRGVGPFTHGAAEHIRVMKSAALGQALDEHGFDALIDGARGDEKRVRESVRAFRSLGCWPLTGAVRSEARDAAAVLRELRRELGSERVGRAEDRPAQNGSNTRSGGYF